jgi:predicted Rossmann fold nucleotide-binding protein DprA/Smf involved in DNA uptake
VSTHARSQLIDPMLPDAGDFTVDELAERSGESPGVVLARLLELELSGQIQRIGGGRFVGRATVNGPKSREHCSGSSLSTPES